MRARHRSSPTLPLMLIGLIGAAASSAGVAQLARDPEGPFAALIRTDERLQPREALKPLEDVSASLAAGVESDWAKLLLDHGDWTAYVDARNSRIEVAEGTGIPWIPGAGNQLRREDIADLLGTKEEPDLAVLEALARRFVADHAALFGVEARDLRLSPGRSGKASDSLWLVDFDLVRGDLTLEGARIVFRVGHGNLIQMGSELLPSAGAVTPVVRVTREAAYAALSSYVSGFDPLADTVLDRGSLHLLSAALRDDRFADGFEFAKGYGLATVWEISFRRKGVMGTWRAKIDAVTGEILEFADINDYAQASGGIYQNSPTTGAEIVRPMPFTNLSSGGFTNSGGVFSGGPLTSSLQGQFVRITDTCGAISLATNGSGDLVFGTSSGTDCATPGVGGAGNTHSSRTQFYHNNRIKEVVKGWLPANAWLNQQLLVNVNLNQTCNAYWDGSSVNFFRSGGGCNNTGELAGVSLHEFGHGIDQNDGSGTAPEGGTGESYGDTTAVIALHASCIGPGFLGSNCGGYGDACTSCTGVRDVDFAKHVGNIPATVANFTQTHCGFGGGPCGREVHCESYVPSEAIWDFANRDLPGPGLGPAWTTLDRLWYLSRSTATSSFSCTTGGTFTSNGCNAGSWWKTMRAVDDDDGNLANGTPHSCNLYAAFNRHGIACTTDAGANTCFRGCAQPTVPALSLAAGNNSVGLSWTSSGAGTVYDVYRNETGCNAGFTKVADNVTGTAFNDGAVANGTTYFYQVVAHPNGNEACHAAPSTCTSVVPNGTKDAQFLNLFVPTSMVPSRQYLVNVTVKNTGGITWNPIGPQCNAYRLAQVFTSTWNPTRADFSAPVASGDQATLTFAVIAPSTPGTYSFQLRMVHECVEFFGPSSPLVTVRVGTKQAQIVAQTVPPVMAAGQPYSASVTIKNTGTLTWSPIGPQCDAYRLAQIGNPAWNPTRVELPSALAAGAQVTLPINGIAPSTPGTYNFQVEMVHECVEFFGAPGSVVAVNVSP